MFHLDQPPKNNPASEQMIRVRICHIDIGWTLTPSTVDHKWIEDALG